MRYLSEFVLLSAMIILALFAFALPPEKPWPRSLRMAILLVAILVSFGAFLYRGVTGKGIDDVLSGALVERLCALDSTIWFCKAEAVASRREQESSAIDRPIPAEPVMSGDRTKLSSKPRPGEWVPPDEAASKTPDRRPGEWIPPDEETSASVGKVAVGEPMSNVDLAARKANLNAALNSTWMEVCTSAKSADDARQHLEAEGFGVNSVALQLVPQWSQTSACYFVTRPVALRLFANSKPGDDTTFDVVDYLEALEEAKQLGVIECPWDLAPALRQKIKNQQNGDVFNLGAQPRPRPGSGDDDVRLPQIGYGAPKDSTWAGTAFQGNYLSVRRFRKYLNSERQIVFCRAA